MTPLLHMLARPGIPPVGCAARATSARARGARGTVRASAVSRASRKLHESAAGLAVLPCLGEASAAGYAGQACLGDTSAGYAGHALHSFNVWVTPLLDLLARPCAGQALYSSNVRVTPLLDMLARPLYSSSVWVTPLLARPCIPPMSG